MLSDSPRPPEPAEPLIRAHRFVPCPDHVCRTCHFMDSDDGRSHTLCAQKEGKHETKRIPAPAPTPEPVPEPNLMKALGALMGEPEGEVPMTTNERIEAAMNLLYERAVAMHESIERGDGATGWQDAKVRNILESLVRGEVMRG